MNPSQVSIVLADRSTVVVKQGETVALTPFVAATLDDMFFTLRNRGAPDRFRVNDAVPLPFYFRSVTFQPAADDLRIPQLTPFDGSRAVGSTWLLVSEDAFKHAHHKAVDPAHPWYAPSTFCHMLDGGDALVVRLASRLDPYDAMRSHPLADDTLSHDILGYDFGLIGAHPLAQANLDLYRFTSASITGAGPEDFGRYLFPQHFTAKYTSWPAELLSGWYGFSDHQLPGDGQCNVHYGHAGHWLASYQATGDPIRRTIGLWLVRAKCALGLIDSDTSIAKNWTIGAWRGEKSGRGRRGSNIGPDSAKEWDYDLLTAAALEPNDPIFAAAVAARRKRLLTIPFAWVWNGSGGGRRAGNYLRNLLDHRRYAMATFDAATRDAFLARAVAFAKHVFALQRTAAQAWFAKNQTPMLWFPNPQVPDRMKAWEETGLYVALDDLDALAPLPAADRALLDDMIVWLTNSGTRQGVVVDPTTMKPVTTGSYIQVAYEVGIGPGPVSPPYFHASDPSNSLWHVPLARVLARHTRLRGVTPAYYRDAALGWRHAPIVTEAYRYVGRTWKTIDQGPLAPAALKVDNPGEGPASHKMRAYAALSLRVGG